ncbi:MAG: cell filamentation protein Fic, partial [Candidatus Nephrothrix sp. EaCA]
LRKLTRQGDAETYIRMMQRAHMFSANIYDQNADAMETYLKSCNAFKEPDEARLKIMVNDND